jgi:hypothetical protein
MRNTMHRNKKGIVRGSILVGLLLALFTMMSFTGSAYAQNQTIHDVPLVAPAQNAPSGRTDLSWNPRSKVLTATLHVSGLQPRSNHAAHIHTGTCASIGRVLYPFKNIIADAAGNGVSVTTINNVTGGIPATGWNVTVHTGTTAQTASLICGNVVNPKKATSVSVPLSAVPAPAPARH